MTARMVVVLLSVDARPNSGWGTMTAMIGEELLRRKEVDLHLLLTADGDVDPSSPLAERTRRVLPPWRRSLRCDLRGWWRTVVPLGLPPETQIVHAVVEFPCAIHAWTAARRAKIPFVVSGQGTYSLVPLLRRPDRWPFAAALRHAAAVTVPSEFTRRVMLDALGEEIPVQVVPNAVDALRFQRGAPDPQATRRRFGLDVGAPLVLSVGAGKRRKGFDVLLDAFAGPAPVPPRTAGRGRFARGLRRPADRRPRSLPRSGQRRGPRRAVPDLRRVRPAAAIRLRLFRGLRSRLPGGRRLREAGRGHPQRGGGPGGARRRDRAPGARR